MSWPGAGRGIVFKTGILFVIETTWEFHNAAWLVCFPGSCIICAAIVLPDRPSEEWSPESKRKLKKGNRQPLVRFKPCFGRAVMVPLPLCPWYFKSVVMYAKHWSRCFARAGVGPHCYACSKRARRSCCGLLRARLTVSGLLTAGLENCLERLLCSSAASAAVCSTIWRERSVFPLTVINPRGPGILSLRYA